MTSRQYLRFCPSSIFGVISSSTARISYFNHKNSCNSIVVPTCENVTIWNLKTKEKALTLNGESSYVTCISCDPNDKIVAVGYADGFVRIFNVKDGSCIVCFCGHKSGVSCLAFENEGLNLASGGKDSEIVIWNVVDQAGLFRLKGHKGPVTKCQFLAQRNILVSSSKDTFIKFWDLDTQHCFQTLVGNRYEVLDFLIIKDVRLITGINGPDLKVWDLFLVDEDLDENKGSKRLKLDLSTNGNAEFKSEIGQLEDADVKFKYKEVGKLLTAGDKTSCLIVDKTERILGCHASTKILQLFKILSSEEVLKRFRKRKRKENKKSKDNSAEEDSLLSESVPSLADEFQALHSIQTHGKLDSFAISVSLDDIAKIVVLLKNNSIYQYELDISQKDNDAVLVHSIVLPGHRSIVKSLSYSQDNQFVLSLSEESAKLWRRYRQQEVCTQTLSCDSAVCAVFVPKNTHFVERAHCVIGTKNGTLDIYEIDSQHLERKVCHDGSVTCLCLSPDQAGITSAGRDKTVKFWDFELAEDEDKDNLTKKKLLSITLKRTLQMPDEVICLCYSPDKQRIAISLLDNTVQVLFVDSLKLIFSLYGHALPVTCMDISYDSTLIATGSEDKDIRIWSMEFGNCNKFIKKAHDKGITCLKFLPKTHMFFTGSRDNTVRQWDADNFQKITTLKGHQNEVNAMAASPDGVSIVTASKDKSIRVWEKTEEPLVLEEELEKEREDDTEVEDLAIVPGEVNKEVSLPGFKTEETIKTVDQLIEAIDVYLQELKKLEEYKLECLRAKKQLPQQPTPHPLLVAYSAETPIHFMRKVVKKVKSSELEGTLLYLPFNYVLEFLKILCEFVERGWEIELCERCSSFLVRIHMGQIIAAQNFLPVIEKLKDKMFSQVYQTRDSVGFVKTACQLQQRAIDAIQEVPMFTSVLDGLQQKKKVKKRSIIAFT